MAMVKCSHGGMAKTAMVFPRVMLSGQPVLLETALFQVAGCALPPPPAANGPCVMGQFSVASTRVLANGLPVLLLDSKGLCAPTGTPLLVATTQTRVTGI
jgi:hypothetical protein